LRIAHPIFNLTKIERSWQAIAGESSQIGV
jgi:hypothetical protein